MKFGFKLGHMMKNDLALRTIVSCFFLLAISAASALAQSETTDNADANTTPNKQAQFVSGNWTLGCQPDSTNKQMMCELSKAITNVGSQQLLARISIGGNPQQMLLQLPHGLALNTGIRLQIDDEKPRQVELHTSNHKGLFAKTMMSAALSKEMSKGKDMKVIVSAINGGEIIIPVSLEGFGISIKKLK